MDFRFLVALALVVLTPACSALVSPDTNRLGGADAGMGTDGGTGNVDAWLPDGARPDADVPDGAVPDGAVPDAGPMCPETCDDGVACTVDSCNAGLGVCVHAPSDAACGGGMRCAGPAGCVPILCTMSRECDDGDTCNGAETCNPGGAGASPTTGCVPGAAPDCRDASDCTEDHCDASTGCFHVPNDGACDDGAACTTDSCGASGCRNIPDSTMCNSGCTTGAVCMPGVGCTGGGTMSCAADGNPCTSDPTTCDVSTGMCLHPLRDEDGDGHIIARATGTSGTVTCGGDDCNDMNGDVHPGAAEVCNSIDDNCDGRIDEGGVCATLPDTCANEQRISLLGGGGGTPLSGSASGNNTSLADNYRPSCGGTGGHDAVYFVDLPPGALGAVDVTVSTDNPGTSFDTVLAAQVGGTCGTYTRACQDDIGGGNNRSTITFCVGAGSGTGARVHILVDGYDGNASSLGTYSVSVSVSPHPGGVCM